MKIQIQKEYNYCIASIEYKKIKFIIKKCFGDYYKNEHLITVQSLIQITFLSMLPVDLIKTILLGSIELIINVLMKYNEVHF